MVQIQFRKNSHGHEPPSQAAQIALLGRVIHSQCIARLHEQESKAALAVRVRDAPTLTAMAGRGLTELQGVTIDFWGGPQLHLWPQAARPL